MDLKFLKCFLKLIFTWWNKQTLRHVFKNIILLEDLLVKMNTEINIIEIKMMKDGLFIQSK